MIRAFRTVVAVAGGGGGIGFVRAGLWFLRVAGGARKASDEPLAGSVTPLPGVMYPLAAMGLGLGLGLRFAPHASYPVNPGAGAKAINRTTLRLNQAGSSIAVRRRGRNLCHAPCVSSLKPILS